VRACGDAMKDAVLEQQDHISEASVIKHMDERASSQQQLL
jgi:hypothetical protein